LTAERLPASRSERPTADDDQDHRLARGREHLRDGRFEAAAEWFERAVRARGRPAEQAARGLSEALFGLGLARIHAGDHPSARRGFERALRADPANAPAARHLARVLLRSGESAAALAWLDHAARAAPEGAAEALLRAVAMADLGLHAGARDALDRSLAATLRSPLERPRPTLRGARRAGRATTLAPLASEGAFHADRRCRLGVRLLDPRPAEAAVHLEAALALNPRYLKARLALGLVRLDQGRAAEAVDEIGAALELEPSYPDVRAWLGLARLAAGDARGAVLALERAVELRREFARAHRHLALAHHALGRTAAALRSARRGVVRDLEAPGSAGPLPGFEAERAEEGELLRGLAIRPGSPDLHLALGRLHQGSGDPTEARRAFRAALAMQPRYAAAALELARAEMTLGRVREAERLLTDLVGWRPAWVDAHALLGRARLLLGEAARAVLPLRAALRGRPQLEPARTDLAWAMLAVRTA
jgi:tetratricopeptide (TPR) repeat protein